MQILSVIWAIIKLLPEIIDGIKKLVSLFKENQEKKEKEQVIKDIKEAIADVRKNKDTTKLMRITNPDYKPRV